jgi:hypothetical protein
MDDSTKKACAERLRTALDLMQSGIEMKRSQLRRRHPDESDTEIQERLDDWLLHPEHSPHGDAEGRPIDPDTIL